MSYKNGNPQAKTQPKPQKPASAITKLLYKGTNSKTKPDPVYKLYALPFLGKGEFVRATLAATR